MVFIVEKINENFVILEKEDLSHIKVDINLMPPNLKEGAVLAFNGENYCLDIEGEERIRKRIIRKQRDIFKK